MQSHIISKARHIAWRGVSALLVALIIAVYPLSNVACAEVNSGITGEFGIVYTTDGNGTFTSTAGTTVNGKKLLGVDVSEHNGEIDWDELKSAGIDFAIIRCGFGGHENEDGSNTDYDDAQFSRNVAECERLGIPYGIYLYSYSTEPILHSTWEANHAVRMAKQCNPTLGVWYDIEEPRQAQAIGYDWSNYVTIMDNFKTIVVSNTNYKVGVYASKSYFDTYLSSSYFDDIPKWYAQWASKPDDGYDYLMWQAGGVILDGKTLDFDIADKLPSMTDGNKGTNNTQSNVSSAIIGNQSTTQATPTPSWTGRSTSVDSAKLNNSADSKTSAVSSNMQTPTGVAYAESNIATSVAYQYANAVFIDDSSDDDTTSMSDMPTAASPSIPTSALVRTPFSR